MGGSQSAPHEYQDDDEGPEQDVIYRSESSDVARRDISPVISEQEDEQGDPMLRQASEHLFRGSSSGSLVENTLPNADTNPWNMFQTRQSLSPVVDSSLAEQEDGNSPFRTPMASGSPWYGTPVSAAALDVATRSGSFAWDDAAWESAEEDPEETAFQDFALSAFSYLSTEVTVADADPESYNLPVAFHNYSQSNGIFLPWMPPSMMPDSSVANRRTLSDAATTVSEEEGDMPLSDFYPPFSQNNEWMGRSIESLLLGHRSAAPVLALPEAEDEGRTEDDAISFERGTMADRAVLRRSSVNNLDTERSSRLAARRRPSPGGPNYRRQNDGAHVNRNSVSGTGPNVLLSLLAREGTGKPLSLQTIPPAQRLLEIGGRSLYDAIDKPAGGIVSEVAMLEDAIDNGNWAETQTIISRLTPRLVGDPILAAQNSAGDRSRNGIDDPSLPASASRYHAGGGRLGFERDAFVLAGGVEQLLRVFREPAFVGDEIGLTNDARDLGEVMADTKLSGCWNEVFACLRELIFAMPILVENGEVLDEGDFLPFLFTLLAHDSCFDGAAALIEEILSFQSHSLQHVPPASSGDEDSGVSRAMGYVTPASTFFLGNVPDLYELWGGFSCRQLAHFCRILALLIFEPEDRQVLESPAVLKSMELLQLRRDRAVRAGRDCTVEMNQAVLLGDLDLVKKLLMLLRIMNFAPPLTRSTPYHVMAHFPFVGDTLLMVGLSEITNWNEIDRLESLARTMLSQDASDEQPGEEHLSDLGSVVDMLESLSGLLNRHALEPTNQLSHIIHVINAAQEAGVIVGIPRQSRRRGRQGTRREETNREEPTQGASDRTDSSPEGESEAVGLSDQIFSRRLHDSTSAYVIGSTQSGAVQILGIGVEGAPTHIPVNGASPRMRVNHPEDAANEMQFNALILAPYQVEVLFVLSTLLGSRRKVDSQNLFRDCGLLSILDEMFHRLSWGSSSHAISMRPSPDAGNEGGDGVSSAHTGTASDGSQPQDQPYGIHGPGCECTAESALSVQYLRLLHNFCDRDCDNHTDRRLLLSATEREFIFSHEGPRALLHKLQPGLLSKVIKTFISESDDSPYRFWLASCVESYLRGSCAQEQLFAAQSGLLKHLVELITSDRLHCAGSLQTSFDLLGELCKGNPEVLRSLMSGFDESSFRKLMSVAAGNLVDSNVFIRSLILSVERISVSQPGDRYAWSAESGGNSWKSRAGSSTHFYLTHSWWEPVLSVLRSSASNLRWVDGSRSSIGNTYTRGSQSSKEEEDYDHARPSDWFPHQLCCSNDCAAALSISPASNTRFEVEIGHNGWIFSRGCWDLHDSACDSSTTIERLCWFLNANRSRLLRDLLDVVDLENINHENICCLNTAVILVMFAHRRNQLRQLLGEFKRIDNESRLEKQRMHRIAAAAESDGLDSIHERSISRPFVESMRLLDITDSMQQNFSNPHSTVRTAHTTSSLRDNQDSAQNFRELIWFWREYYVHRGRDRLSLEFSSHLRFQEWKSVISILGADDGSSTSLVASKPTRLPRSPYQRGPRVAETMDNHARGE